MEILRRRTAFTIGDNEPYDAREFNYTMDRHAAARRVRHVTIEVRQDLLTAASGVSEIAGILGSAFEELLQIDETGPNLSA
jgi:predicted N-formylglutamate amidohydrolase